MKRIWIWILGVAGFLFAGFIGLWSQSLFTTAESVHFSVNFPSVTGAEGVKTMSCCDLGGPWANIPSQDWTGYPSGGLLVWGREGCVILDLGKTGFLKRVLQPGYINLSTHWLRNVGTQPYQIKLKMDLCDMPFEWSTHESEWDLVRQVTTREINPGQVFNMDWYIDIPPESLNQNVICQGNLEVLDAQTDTSLTVLPITIINSKAQ